MQAEILRLKDASEKQAYKLVYSHLFKTLRRFSSMAQKNGVGFAMASLDTISRQDTEAIFVEIYTKVGFKFYELQEKELDKQKRINPGFFSEIWRQIIIAATKDIRIASLITAVTNTTRNQVRSILIEAAENRLAPRQIAKLFNDKLNVFGRSRAITIARTETGAAAAIGIEQAAKNSGLQLYTVWYHATHGQSREEHLALHLKIKPKGQAFDVEGTPMLYPHDYSGGAKNNVNCRCTHSYITADVAREMGLM